MIICLCLVNELGFGELFLSLWSSNHYIGSHEFVLHEVLVHLELLNGRRSSLR